MLLHIGENRFVPENAVVAIFPADQISPENDRLIRECAETGRYYPSYSEPKSYVLCEKDGCVYIYAASTAMRTLKERISEQRS
jgi:hypothetical protein